MPAVLDAQALARLRELDPKGENRLIERVLKAFETSVARLAPQLDEARRSGDRAGIRHVAHTLKSSSASIGALALSQRCAEVETLIRLESTEDLSAPLDALSAELAVVLKAHPNGAGHPGMSKRAVPRRRRPAPAAQGAAGRRRRGQPAADLDRPARARLRHHRGQQRRAGHPHAGRLAARRRRARRADARPRRLRDLPRAAPPARLRVAAGADAHRPGRRCLDHPRLRGRRHRLLRQVHPVEPARRAAALPAALVAHPPGARAQQVAAGARAGPGAHGQLRLEARRRRADLLGRGPARVRPRRPTSRCRSAPCCACCPTKTAAAC